MFDDLLNQFSEGISPTIEMNEPNIEIQIFNGKFEIQNSEINILIEGEIVFNWFPTPKARFRGKTLSIDRKKLQNIIECFDLSLIIDNSVIGDCFITSTQIVASDSYISLTGEFKFRCEFGDVSNNLSSIKFMLLNFRDVLGEPVKYTSEKKVFKQLGRILLSDENYSIILDKLSNFKGLASSLEKKGGFITLYSGEIKKNKNELVYSKMESYFHCLSTFLSFINGQRTAPYFLQGIKNEEIVFSDFTSYQIDISTKYITSWLPKAPSNKDLQELWISFLNLWKGGHKEFLLSAVHWYIESNKTAGYAEGSIIMSQVGLELLYNWLIVEKKQILLGKDAENIAAANKLRLLLTNLGFNTEVPIGLSNLRQFAKNRQLDGPGCFVQIRNSIVHSQSSKRDQLNTLSIKVRSEVLNLGIWYLEICLLSILGYKGKYSNRCTDKNSHSEREQLL